MGSLNNSDNFLHLLEFAVLQAPELEGTAPRHSLLRLCSSAAKAGVTRLRGSPKILLHHLTLAFTLWKCSLPQEGALPNVLACASEYRSGHLGQGHLPSQNLLYGGGDQTRGLTAPNSSANEVTSTEQGVPPIKARAWYQGGAGAGLLFWEVYWSLQRQAGDFRDFAVVPRVGAGGGWGDILLSLNGSARLGSGSKCEDLGEFPELCSVGK